MDSYKIRNTKTGKYSLGGIDPSWGEIGKVWAGIGPLRLHLRQFQIKELADWEVIRVAVKPRSDEVLRVPAQQLYEPKSKFEVKLSDTLIALLNYSRQEKIKVSWKTLRDQVLAHIYHRDMSTVDVLTVVSNAFNEAKEIPEFKMGASAYSLIDLLDYPRKQIEYRQMIGERILFTYDLMVNYQLEFMINQLRFSTKDWCKKQLSLSNL